MDDKKEKKSDNMDESISKTELNKIDDKKQEKKEEIEEKKFAIRDNKGNVIEVTKNDLVFGIVCYECWNYILGLSFYGMNIIADKSRKIGCLNCSSKMEINLTDKFKIQIGKEEFKIKMSEYSEDNKKKMFKYMI